ncbi:MAG: PorV/PorQ family protein [bacterium]
MKKYYFTAIIIFICAKLIFASDINSKAGTTGADFLKVPADSFSQAMGGMSFGYGRYASCLFENPACMSSLPNSSLSIGTSKWLLDSQYNSVALVIPLRTEQKKRAGKQTQVKEKKTSREYEKPAAKKNIRRKSIASSRSGNRRDMSGRSAKKSITGRDHSRKSITRKGSAYGSGTLQDAIGFGVIYFDAGEVKETVMDTFDNITETGNALAAKDLCGIISYSKALGSCSIGINAKYIKRELASEKAAAFAADIGAYKPFLLAPVENTIFLGVVIENLGGKLDFLSETPHKDDLPTQYGIGAVWKIQKVLFALNLSKPIDNDFKSTLGFEYDIMDEFNFRCGYKISGIDRDAIGGSLTGFSAGLNFPLKVINGSISYSYVPFNELKTTHHFTLNICFGQVYRDDQYWFYE